MGDVFNHLDEEVQRRMRELVPDDLGEYDDQMSTIDASTLLDDLRRQRCVDGHHRWTHFRIGEDQDKGRRCTVCERHDVLQLGDDWRTIVPCRFIELTPVTIAVDTYRTIPAETEAPPSWWQRFMAWFRASV